MIGIYKITNKINGKAYIGQSNDTERRWKEHKNNYKRKNTELYQAMKKDGIENFIFSIEELCSLEELDEKEKSYICLYHSDEDGYNMNNVVKLQYIINEEIAKQIVEDLKMLSLSQNEIAIKYNVSHSLISQINTGKMWSFEKEKYPIRKNNFVNSTINYCPNCGKTIGYKSKMCVACYKKTQSEHIVNLITREELKKQIREKSFAEIARNYHTTDKSIKRWCNFYKLPLTKREILGYSDEEWNKI